MTGDVFLCKWLFTTYTMRLGEGEVSRMVEFSATCSLINNDRLHLKDSKETLLPFSCQDIFMHYRIGHTLSWHSKVSAVMHLKRQHSDIQGQQLISIKPFGCYALAFQAPPFACLLETRLMGRSAMNTEHSDFCVSLQKRTGHNLIGRFF